LRPVGGCAVFDGVVDDDAIVLIGDLALYPNPAQAVDADLADRPGIGGHRAGRTVRRLPGQPDTGLRDDRAGPLDRDC
jgi:hypothetical protein